MVGSEVAAVETDEPLGAVALDGQRELVGQRQSGVPVVGIVVLHVGQQHLHGVVVGWFGQSEVGLRRDVVAGFGVNPQAVAEKSLATLGCQVEVGVFEGRRRQQVLVANLVQGGFGTEVAVDGRTINRIIAVVKVGVEVFQLVALLELDFVRTTATSFFPNI